MQFIKSFLKLLFICFIVGLLGIKSNAQQNTYKPLTNPTNFITTFGNINSKVNTIQSDFTQEKHLEMLESSIVSKGKFKYQKEAKLKLSYTSPIAYQLVINQGKILIKEGKKITKFDANAQKSFKQINEIMMEALSGNVLESKNYEIKYFESQTSYLLELSPIDKSLKDIIKLIKLHIDKNSFDVHIIEMIETSSDFTIIKLSNIKKNSIINHEEFLLK